MNAAAKSILTTLWGSWRKRTRVWKSRKRSSKVWKIETWRIRGEWPKSRGSSEGNPNVIPHYRRNLDLRWIAAGKKIREIFWVRKWRWIIGKTTLLKIFRLSRRWLNLNNNKKRTLLGPNLKSCEPWKWASMKTLKISSWRRKTRTW